jgi:hypothetical protein
LNDGPVAPRRSFFHAKWSELLQANPATRAVFTKIKALKITEVVIGHGITIMPGGQHPEIFRLLAFRTGENSSYRIDRTVFIDKQVD